MYLSCEIKKQVFEGLFCFCANLTEPHVITI